MTKYNHKTSAGAALVSAISLKLCCWGPLLLTGIAGVSGSSVYFTWLSNIKPYLLTISFLSLGLAFYQVYRPQKDTCHCAGACEADRRAFNKSKLYVWLVAIFVAVMTTISYLPQKFDAASGKGIIIVDEANLETIKLDIEGISCTGCEENINYSVSQLEGIIAVKTSFKKGTAVIKFDNSRASLTEIKEVIKSRGFAIKPTRKPG